MFGWLLVWLCCPASIVAQAPGNSVAPGGLTLEEVVRRVVEQNESIQMKMLEAEISRKTLKAEESIFEPAVVSSVRHIDSQRPNNVQEQRSLLTSQLDERNTLYDGGLEFLSPIGSRFRLGVTFRDLHNNLQRLPSILSVSTNPISHEYESFVGLSVVQPLLKNFGVNATTVRIRLAAAASELAFQDYRRQLMITVGRAESAYWDLYLTQEQERISQESIATAQAILSDNENRLKLGRSSELEVLQSQAGLALRKARYGEARTKRVEGASQLASLLSEPGILTNMNLRAIDKPVIRAVPLTYFDSYQQAYQLNPDYLSRKTQVNQENIRLAYARNQRLPQLDFKADYGFNGLGHNPSEAWEDVGRYNFPVWSVGLEMRIPITGGIRERNELEAAKLSQDRALLALKEVEIQIGNALDSAMNKTRGYADNLESYQQVVSFHQQLVDSQLERLKLGRVDTLTVLQNEEKLFEARIAALDNIVQYEKAFLEMELVTGSTLAVRDLEITRPQLKAKTEAYLQERLSPAALEKYAAEAAKQYFEDLSPRSLSTRRALSRLHQEMSDQELEAQRKALDLLRVRVRELEQAPSSAAPGKPGASPAATDPHNQALELLRQKLRQDTEGQALPGKP